MIGRIEYMLLMTLIAIALSFKIFLLTNIFLHLGGKVLQTFMTKMKLWLHGSAEPESVAVWET